MKEASVYEGFDELILRNVIAIRTESLTVLMRAVTEFGDAKVLWAGTIALLALFWIKRRAVYFSALLLSMAGASAIVMFLKYLFERARPHVAQLMPENGYSFPSGHGALALAFWGIVVYFLIHRASSLWTKGLLAFVAPCVVALIGFSRLYLGVHWPSDIAASYVIGGTWLFFVIAQAERKLHRPK